MELLKQLFAPFVMIIITSGLSFVAASYWWNKKAKQEAIDKKGEADETLKKQVADLERQLSQISNSVQPLNAAFQAMLVKQLTHFHTPVLDALLAKLDPFTLTPEEEQQMHLELDMRVRDLDGDIDESERDAAKMMPMLIKRVRKERAEEKELKIVSVQKDSELG